MSIQQTHFDTQTGIPRWGCMFMSLVYAGFHVEGKEPSSFDVLKVYNDALNTPTPKWKDGVQVGVVPTLEMVDPSRYEIYVNNPTMVLELAIAQAGGVMKGAQYPDLDTRIPAQYPKDYRLTYTLLNFRRPSNDGHWVLGDRSGMNVIYNPDESLDIDWWSRSPSWRGIRILMK